MLCRYVAARDLLAVSALFLFASTASSSSLMDDGAPTPDETLQRVEDKLGNNERRYDKLLKDVDAAVQAALVSASWGPEGEAGEESSRTLASHPHLLPVQELHDAALARMKRRKNPREVVEQLDRYPWHKLLELPRGLEHGSDRPIPKNDNGFIHLATPGERLPGYPELHVNHYLWSTGEIAGWQTGVKKGKAAFTGRKAKDTVAPCEALPSHEAMRVYLTGNLPEAPLLAIPELQHRIHSTLASLRSSGLEEGKRHPMDEVFSHLESKWNGFVFEPAYAKKEFVFTAPLHSLMADMTSFPFRFENSDAMKLVGDLPFTAVQTHMEYSEIFRGQQITASDLIAKTSDGKAVLEDFTRDVTYLNRYRALVDLMVRALLSPEIPYPEYLRVYDYPSANGHAAPEHRTPGTTYDVPRRHALLIWAACGLDPAKVGQWLHDELLSKERFEFPSNESLPIAMLGLSRAQEGELLDAVVAAIGAEREARAADAGPGPFELQFSPFETYLASDGEPNANALANSFHRCNAQLSAPIAGAALEAIRGRVD